MYVTHPILNQFLFRFITYLFDSKNGHLGLRGLNLLELKCLFYKSSEAIHINFFYDISNQKILTTYFLGTTAIGDLIIQNENISVSNSLGFLKDNVQLKIVDEKTGEILGPNQVGEMVFKKRAPLLSYYDNPKAKPIDDDGNHFF